MLMATNFHANLAQICGGFWDYSEIHHFLRKLVLLVLGTLLNKLGYFFISTSGYTVRNPPQKVT